MFVLNYDSLIFQNEQRLKHKESWSLHVWYSNTICCRAWCTEIISSQGCPGQIRPQCAKSTILVILTHCVGFILHFKKGHYNHVHSHRNALTAQWFSDHQPKVYNIPHGSCNNKVLSPSSQPACSMSLCNSVSPSGMAALSSPLELCVINSPSTYAQVCRCDYFHSPK